MAFLGLVRLRRSRRPVPTRLDDKCFEQPLDPRPASGCQRTPTAKRRDGSSIASTVPSSARAATRRPSPSRPKPWWWCDFTVISLAEQLVEPRARSRSRPRGRAKRARRLPCARRRRRPRAGAGRGRRRAATFSTCEPRQIASTGRSRASAASQQARARRVPLRHDPGRLRVRLLPVERRVEVGAAREDQPVERIERLLDRPRRRAGRAAAALRPLDRAHVVVRERAPTRAPRPRTRPAVTYVVMPIDAA